MTKYILIFLLLTAVTYAQSGKSVLSPAQKDSIAAMISDSLENYDLTNYVDKTSIQTIPGQKTFSNSKTVFSGDSVGIRGKLDVDGSVYFYGGTGDVNGDGGIYGEDYKVINFYLSGDTILTKAQLMEADINGDGNVDWSDLIIYGEIQAYEEPFDIASGYVAAKTNGIRIADSLRGSASYQNFHVRGTLIVDSTFTFGEITLPDEDGSVNEVLKTDGNGNLYFGSDATGSGGSAYTDSIVIHGRHTTGDSVATLADLPPDSLLKISGSTYKLSYPGSTINNWFSGLDTWVSGLFSTSNVLRLGKSYADRRFNNGNYTDVWIIDYVIPPYNLSANWLYAIEHRTDYYNDTLNTVAHSDILNVDGTGTPIWRTNDVRIMGNELQINVGDLPDSSALDWTYAGLTGNKVILSELGKTPLASLFPMPVKGFEFKFGSTPYYVYPKVYSFYSDLTTNSPDLDSAYHFYGRGNYPSYFGGNILTDGYIKVQDSIIIGSSTVKIYPDSITVRGTRLAKITEAGSLDTTIVNDLIEANEDSSGTVLSYTATEIDSLLGLAGTAIQSGSAVLFDTLSYSWGIMDTTTTGSLPGWKVPNNITITEISAYTDANTCTFNIEERAETTPNTAGTDVIGSDLVADNDQQETGTFSNATIDKNSWLVPTISATGDVSIFSITVRYVKTN